jgi:hypothetical protein
MKPKEKEGEKDAAGSLRQPDHAVSEALGNLPDALDESSPSIACVIRDLFTCLINSTRLF